MNRWPFVLAAFVACCAPALMAARPSLTPADIEQATGLRGIHLVPETTKGAVPGRSNYADGSGQIVLWFHDFDAQGFARAKAQPARTLSGIEIEPKLFHAAVAGFGDEAFDSPDGKLQHALITEGAGGVRAHRECDRLPARRQTGGHDGSA
jgi:hypothetical protein